MPLSLPVKLDEDKKGQDGSYRPYDSDWLGLFVMEKISSA
jgi:hypothetical protein